MNAISARQKPIGASATSMNRRRRPSGGWKVSLHGPVISGSETGKKPPAEGAGAIDVFEFVKRPSWYGRYAATTVIENARPNAPRPSTQIRVRCDMARPTTREP